LRSWNKVLSKKIEVGDRGRRLSKKLEQEAGSRSYSKKLV